MSVLGNTGPMKKHYSYNNNAVYMCVYTHYWSQQDFIWSKIQ